MNFSSDDSDMEPSLEDYRLFFNKLAKLRDMFCDITLEVEGTEFKCNRIILSASSDYFSTMLTSQNFTESKMDKISLFEVDKIGFLSFLDFAYTKQVSLTVGNMHAVLKTARFFLVEGLEKIAVNFVTNHVKRYITRDNVCEFCSFYTEFEIPELTKFIIDYLYNNKDSILNFTSESYVLLPFTIFQDFLNDLDLKHDGFCCELIVQWVKHDIENRAKYFGELLGILFKQLDSDISILDDLVSDHEILVETVHEAWKNAVIENPMYVVQFRYYDEPEFCLDVFSYIRYLSFEYSTVGDIKLMIGIPVMYNNDQMYLWSYIEKLLCFVHITNQETVPFQVLDKPAHLELLRNIINLKSVVPIKHSSQIYASFRSDTLNFPTLYCYNADINALHAIDQENNNNNINNRSLVNYENVIYLCGGRVGNTSFLKNDCNIVTLYDPRTSKCQDVGSLLLHNCASAITTLNDSIYITGELDGDDRTVERYDIIAGKSELIYPTPYSSHNFAITYNSRIWLGGKEVVETYNETSKIWKEKTVWEIVFDDLMQNITNKPHYDFRRIYLFA